MPLYLQRRLDLSVATDSAMEQLVADRTSVVSDSTMEASTVFARKIAVSTNLLVAQGEVATVKALRIEYSAAVNLRIGAVDADPIPLAPISEGQTGVAHLELQTAGPIYIQNPSATATVAVNIILAGDAT